MYRPHPIPRPDPFVPRPHRRDLIPWEPKPPLVVEGRRRPYRKKKAKAREHRKAVRAYKRRMRRQGKAA